MSQMEGRNAAARLLATLALIAAVIWLGNARAASAAASAATMTAGQQDALQPPICRHDQFSQWYCPDTAKNFQWLGESTEFTRAQLTITYAKGRERTFPLPKGTDAVFLSKYAVENFLIRYYDGTASAVKARDLRAYVAAHSGSKRK